MRRAARRDDNESTIIAIFRRYGWVVRQLSAEDVPDLLCAHHGVNILVEVVGEAKLKKYPPHGLSPNQYRFHQDWPGPIYVVKSHQDAHDIARWDL